MTTIAFSVVRLLPLSVIVAAGAVLLTACDDASVSTSSDSADGVPAANAVPLPTAASAASDSPQQTPQFQPPSSASSDPRQLAVRVDAAQPIALNLGDVAPHSRHQVVVSLTNPTSQPVTIEKAVPDCACTTTEELAGRAIAAGETLTFPISFTARSEPGEKNAKLFIVVEGGRYRPLIQLSANIVMPVMAEPAYVDALKGKNTGTVEVYSRDGQPFRILSSNGQPPQLVGGSAGGEPANRYSLAWDVTDFAGPGMKLWWIVETDRADCPILPLRIRHEWSGSQADPDRRARGWIMKEYIVNAASVPAGKPVELEAVLDNPKRQRITSVQSLSSDATIEMISQTDVGEKESLVSLRLTPREGFTGLLYAMARFNSPTGHADCAVVAQVK